MDPFLQALPSAQGLPATVWQLHETAGLYSGRCQIERGKGWLIGFALRMGRFPPSGADVPVTVRTSETKQGWIWERDFDGHKTRSSLTYDQRTGCVREDFGRMTIWLKPELSETGLKIGIRGLTIFGLPVPAFLLPCSSTVERQDEQGRFRFDVSATAPGLGLLIRYRGWLTPVHAQGGSD